MDPIDQAVVDTKQLRVDLDAALQRLKALPPTRERALSITKIQEAIMWLGMDLKAQNEKRPPSERAPSPYPSSYDPTTPKVEPTADGLKL